MQFTHYELRTMNYNIIAESNEATVAAKYIPEKRQQAYTALCCTLSLYSYRVFAQLTNSIK